MLLKFFGRSKSMIILWEVRVDKYTLMLAS